MTVYAQRVHCSEDVECSAGCRGYGSGECCGVVCRAWLQGVEQMMACVRVLCLLPAFFGVGEHTHGSVVEGYEGSSSLMAPCAWTQAMMPNETLVTAQIPRFYYTKSIEHVTFSSTRCRGFRNVLGRRLNEPN